MKNNFLNLFLSAVVTIAFIGTTSAQNADKQRLSREELAIAQAKNIADKLALNDKVTKQFIETFSECQKQLWALRPEKRPDNPSDTMTEEQAKKAIQDQFEHSQRILDIRKEYYNKYSKFLTQKQIKRVYDLEKKAMKRFEQKSMYLDKSLEYQRKIDERKQKMGGLREKIEEHRAKMEEKRKKMNELHQKMSEI